VARKLPEGQNVKFRVGSLAGDLLRYWPDNS